MVSPGNNERLHELRLWIAPALALCLACAFGQAQDRPRSLAPLEFEPQDWTTPKYAWRVNQSSETHWNLWSTDKDAEKRWTKGVVLQGPTVREDRKSPEDGAPPTTTRLS